MNVQFGYKKTVDRLKPNVFGDLSDSDDDMETTGDFKLSPSDLEQQAIEAINKGDASMALNKFNQVLEHPLSDIIITRFLKSKVTACKI